METTLLSKNGKLLLPKRLRKKYGIKPGVAMAFLETEHGLLIKVIDADYFDQIAGLLKDFIPTIEEFKAWKEK